MFSRIFTILLLLIALKATAQRGVAQRDAAQRSAAQRGVAQRSAAQRDLIITQAGEQIRCRIVEESSMRFSYIYVNEKGKPVKTEIFKTLISSFKYNYFPEDLQAGDKTPPATGESAAKNSRASEKKDTSPQGADTRDPAKSSATGEKKDALPQVAQKSDGQNASGKPSESKTAKENAARKSSATETPPPVTGTAENTAKSSATGEKKDTPPAVAQKSDGQNASGKPSESKTAKDNAARKSSAEETPPPVTGTAENTAKNSAKGEKKDTPPAVTAIRDSTLLGGENEQESEYVSPLKGKTEFTNYLKYRIGFKGGLGNIIDDNTDKSPFGLFNEKLRRGWVYGVDAAVFLTDHIGIGLTYQSFQSQNKNANLNSPIPLATGEDFLIRSLESKVNHKFVGPTLLGRIGMDYKTFIVATVTPGYYFYSDKGIVNQMNYEYKGGAWGGAATLGIDFLIGNNETGRDIILSFECGYNYGQLKNLSPDKNGWHKLPIQMNRLDFAVGLRFTRFPRYLR